MHTRKKYYQCSQCENTFFDNTNLKIHLKTHTWGKPYQNSHVKEVSHKIPILKNISHMILLLKIM